MLGCKFQKEIAAVALLPRNDDAGLGLLKSRVDKARVDTAYGKAYSGKEYQQSQYAEQSGIGVRGFLILVVFAHFLLTSRVNIRTIILSPWEFMSRLGGYMVVLCIRVDEIITPILIILVSES